MAFGSAIKSIQQGTGEASVTGGAISTVNIGAAQGFAGVTSLTKAEVKAWVVFPKANGLWATAQIAPVLTTTANLRLFIDHGGGGTSATVTYTWQVIEHY